MNSAINRFVNTSPQLQERVSKVLAFSGSPQDLDKSQRGIQLSLMDGQIQATALVRPSAYEDGKGSGFTTNQEGATVFKTPGGDTFEMVPDSGVPTPKWAQNLRNKAYSLINKEGREEDQAPNFGEVKIDSGESVKFDLEAYALKQSDLDEQITPTDKKTALYEKKSKWGDRGFGIGVDSRVVIE